ncbi:MAG TPA: transposase [Chloroflexia bacterium]|nr:transposase [Chloroflexia bacterium]
MRKTFLYRLYPTKAQATRLRHMLDECRWVYNALLEQRKVYWEEAEISVSMYAQHQYLPFLKEERPQLSAVHSQVLQNVSQRVDLAFQAFFRRVKAGEHPGYPRFRGVGRYDSFTYPQYGNGAKLNGAQLQLSKVGTVAVVLHRPIEGTPKTVTIKRSSTGKWYVAISCAWEPSALPPHDSAVGIDVGLSTFATLSDGTTIANPRFFRQEEQALAKVSRRHSQLEKGSRARRKHRQAVARVHERVRFRRHNFTHQHSRRIVNRQGTIAVEDLAVNRMVRNHCLSKSISDAAWSGFSELLAWKAACAARRFVRVNPAYTSQTCSSCGNRLPPDKRLGLSERVFDCPCCGLHLDRDLNAALNILALGLQRIGTQSVEAPAFTPGE